MENKTATVEFICSPNRKIIIDFELDEHNMLNYHPRFEPQEIDPKEDLGLGAELCQYFIEALENSSKTPEENQNPK